MCRVNVGIIFVSQIHWNAWIEWFEYDCGVYRLVDLSAYQICLYFIDIEVQIALSLMTMMMMMMTAMMILYLSLYQSRFNYHSTDQTQSLTAIKLLRIFFNDTAIQCWTELTTEKDEYETKIKEREKRKKINKSVYAFIWKST